jgi:hypothetical protein
MLVRSRKVLTGLLSWTIILCSYTLTDAILLNPQFVSTNDHIETGDNEDREEGTNQHSGHDGNADAESAGGTGTAGKEEGDKPHDHGGSCHENWA